MYVLNDIYPTHRICCGYFNSNDPPSQMNRNVRRKLSVRRVRWRENTQVNLWILLEAYMEKHFSVTYSTIFISSADSTSAANFSKWHMTPHMVTSWGFLYPSFQLGWGALDAHNCCTCLHTLSCLNLRFLSFDIFSLESPCSPSSIWWIPPSFKTQR